MVRVKSALVYVTSHMKYLGVMLDSKLTFKPHFRYINEKVGKVTRALGRLMSNLRGHISCHVCSDLGGFSSGLRRFTEDVPPIATCNRG